MLYPSKSNLRRGYAIQRFQNQRAVFLARDCCKCRLGIMVRGSVVLKIANDVRGVSIDCVGKGDFPGRRFMGKKILSRLAGHRYSKVTVTHKSVHPCQQHHAAHGMQLGSRNRPVVAGRVRCIKHLEIVSVGAILCRKIPRAVVALDRKVAMPTFRVRFVGIRRHAVVIAARPVGGKRLVFSGRVSLGYRRTEAGHVAFVSDFVHGLH